MIRACFNLFRPPLLLPPLRDSKRVIVLLARHEPYFLSSPINKRSILRLNNNPMAHNRIGEKRNVIYYRPIINFSWKFFQREREGELV